MELAKELLEKAKAKSIQLLLPLDSIAAESFNNDARKLTTPDVNIPDGYMGLDIGPETIKLFNKTILESSTIIWNGPMGVFEMSSFETGTRNIAMTVAEATKKVRFHLLEEVIPSQPSTNMDLMTRLVLSPPEAERCWNYWKAKYCRGCCDPAGIRLLFKVKVLSLDDNFKSSLYADEFCVSYSVLSNENIRESNI